MDFEDLVTARMPPPNRLGMADCEHEHHLYEGAVMVAYAMHRLRTESTNEVSIHPSRRQVFNDMFRKSPIDNDSAQTE
jgi:hypothetical protein